MGLSNRDGVVPNRRLVVNILVLVYLFSGICSLIDEVVWLRLLKLIIGNTVYASSVVVSVFMGGLAIGAALSARYCDRFKRPLRAYAIIELTVTTTVLLSPSALRLADMFYVWLWRTYHPTQGLLIFWQALLSALILLVPTILMGSTLPLLARFVTSVEKESGSLVGRLYALNTLGAALGTFLAGFVLIRTIGVMETLYTAAIVNVGVACGGYLLYRIQRAQDTGGAVLSPPPSVPEKPTSIVRNPSRAGLWLLACGFFLSGLACIGYEILWMRSIIHSIGTFTYVFSAVLTVYLVGNAIGTMIGSRVVRSLERPAAAYAATLFVLGATGAVYIPWLDVCNYHILPWIAVQPELAAMDKTIPLRMLDPLVQCTVLFLFPSMVMGFGFPLMVQAWVNRVHRVGLSTGFSYSINTIGAVLGGLLAGFVLIPLLGLQASVTNLGLAVVWVATAMWIVFIPAVTRKWTVRCLVPLAAVFVTMCAANVPHDLFLRSVALSGRPFGHELVAMREGINTTVSIHRDPKRGALYLYASGRIVAGTSPGFRGDQKMLGHFPVLLDQYANQTLSVGFGTGESTACLAMHDLKRIDCAEIAPEVVPCALQYFREINLGDKLDQTVNMIYMDARNYLHLTEQKYDVIMSDCTGMTLFAENGSLFTKDYFECAKAHLNKHGMFMSWIDSYAMESEPIVNSVIGTVMDVFPYVTLWCPTPEPLSFFVIVGSDEPQTFSIQHILNEFNKPAVRQSLAKITLDDAADVFRCYVADERDIGRFIKQYTCNTDDRPFLEFTTVYEPAARSFTVANERGGRAVLRDFLHTVRSNSVYQHLDWTGLDEACQRQWLERITKVREVTAYIQRAQVAGTYDESYRCCVEGLKIIPDYPALLTTKRLIEREFLEAGLQGIHSKDTTEALTLANFLLGQDPNSVPAWILRSQASRAQGNARLAVAAARRAVQAAPTDMSVYYNLWSILVWADDPQGAQAVLDRAVEQFESSGRPAEASRPGQ
jgi:spermidine synthase